MAALRARSETSGCTPPRLGGRGGRGDGVSACSGHLLSRPSVASACWAEPLYKQRCGSSPPCAGRAAAAGHGPSMPAAQAGLANAHPAVAVCFHLGLRQVQPASGSRGPSHARLSCAGWYASSTTARSGWAPPAVRLAAAGWAPAAVSGWGRPGRSPARARPDLHVLQPTLQNINRLLVVALRRATKAARSRCCSKQAGKAVLRAAGERRLRRRRHRQQHLHRSLRDT